MDGLGADQFQRVHMNEIPFVEDLLTLNIVLYDNDIVDGNIIGELARGNVQKYENGVRPPRYNNHISYVNNINAVFQSFRCPNCDTFFNKTVNLERHLTTCSERVKSVYPRSVYQIRETICDKLDSFGIKNTSQQKLFENLEIFGFGLVSQSKGQMELLFLDVKTTIKIKVGSILEKLTQRHNLREHARLDMNQDDCDNESCASTQFLQILKNQLFDLHESLERNCNVLHVFGFNSAKYDLSLIESYLLSILVNERVIEPTFIKKANQFISFKFGEVQLLDIMNFLGGATSLDSYLKVYKTSETEGFFPYEWFDHPDKKQNTEFPPFDAFYS